jgi:hypothetical protein
MPELRQFLQDAEAFLHGRRPAKPIQRLIDHDKLGHHTPYLRVRR